MDLDVAQAAGEHGVQRDGPGRDVGVRPQAEREDRPAAPGRRGLRAAGGGVGHGEAAGLAGMSPEELRQPVIEHRQCVELITVRPIATSSNP